VAGIDRVDAEPAAAVLVRAEGRALHCILVRAYADGHGGGPLRAAPQGHALHGNVSLVCKS
jgi:hypothetical protein